VTEPTRTQQLRKRWGVREVDRRRFALDEKNPRPVRGKAAAKRSRTRTVRSSVPRLSFFEMVSIVLADQENRHRNKRQEIR
jgi:hypothetical protein